MSEPTTAAKPTRIFLIGPMGAGKSTVGRALAKSLSLRFVDSDRAIEERTGASIALIFDIEGEAGFREREHAMIDTLSKDSNIVLATGGGAILDVRTRRLLAERGTVVYLKTSVDTQLRRTSRDRNRPLLRGGRPRATLERLMAERAPLYDSIADITMETDTRGPQVVVSRLLRRLAQSLEDD